MLYIAVWLVCSVLTFGLSFAYFQRKYPYTAESNYKEDFGFCFTLGLLGPLAFIAFLILVLVENKGKLYGFKFY